jgi:sortase A
MLLNVQRCLWAIGFIVLGYCGMAWFSARLHQSEGSAELDRLRTTQQSDDVRTTTPPHGGLVGRMEIPRLHLSAVIFEGTDEPVLSEGVGHLTGSALPGHKGNVVLAGHRDSFFRALRNIKGGDVVDVDTEQGSRRYVVRTTRIIQPTQIEVLEPTKKPTLTLVTCYPFYYVGHAPKRFIVQGTLAEVQPDPPTEARLR